MVKFEECKAPQRSESWFSARKGIITASRIAAAIGVNPYQTRQELIREMVRENHGLESEFQGNAATEWGAYHEDIAKDELESQFGFEIQPCGLFTVKDSNVGASPDGLVNKDSTVEIKCPYSKREEEEPEFNTLSEQPQYKAQVQLQLYCTNRKTCYFYQWAPNGNVLEIEHRDDAYIDWMLKEVQVFLVLLESELDNPEHLEPLYRTLEPNQALIEYAEAKAALEAAEKRFSDAKGALIKLADGKNTKIGWASITNVKRAGNISYKKACDKLLKGQDLEMFRGKGTEYWMVK